MYRPDRVYRPGRVYRPESSCRHTRWSDQNTHKKKERKSERKKERKEGHGLLKGMVTVRGGFMRICQGGRYGRQMIALLPLYACFKVWLCLRYGLVVLAVWSVQVRECD